EYYGTAAFCVVAMFAVFILTAFFHLIVVIKRMISPARSKHANLLYMILAICTTVIVILLFVAQALTVDNAFVNFFKPSYQGLACKFGYLIALIPVYYWFFYIYSHIAKTKSPKKEKKSRKSKDNA
ncbi:MAG: hypothetical protein K2M64_00150, partial [Clostridia bacterium]|nr:hypothetical protein [Clostridia bacterium]